MAWDDADDEAVTAAEEADGGRDRRRAFRRKLPFGRGALLTVGERKHIVGLADISVSGAYLIARAPVAAGEVHLLNVLLLPARVEMALKVEVVRVSLADAESNDHPRGVAVRFLDVEDDVKEMLQAFVGREGWRRA